MSILEEYDQRRQETAFLSEYDRLKRSKPTISGPGNGYAPDATAEAAFMAEYERIKTERQKTADVVGFAGAVNAGKNMTGGNLPQSVLSPVVGSQVASGAKSSPLFQQQKEKANPYAAIAQAEDFQEKSRYATTARTEKGNDFLTLLSNMGIGLSNAFYGSSQPFSAYGDKTVYDDPMYEYINGNQAAIQEEELRRLQMYGGLYTLDSIEHLKQMTEDEVKVYNYLYATQGKEKAGEYVNGLEEELQKRWRAATQEQAQTMAKDDPVGSSILSTLVAPGKGVAYLGQAMDMLKNGTVNENAAYNYANLTGQGIRSTISKALTDSGKWGAAGSFLYNTGMSMADFLLTTGITGGQSGPAMVIMGTGAAADTVLEAKQRGVEDKQAFALGTIAGVAEAVMEKIGLDALFDTKLLNRNTWGYLVKNVLSEGTEELGTDAVNLLADILIAKDQSEWAQSIHAYQVQGMSDKDAFWRAVRDQAVSMGLSFLGGSISGGVIAGGGVAVNTIFGGEGNATTEDTGNNQNTEQPTQQEVAEETVDPVQDIADRLMPIQTAVDQFRSNGNISNRMAEILLSQGETVESLQEQTGIAITGTKSQQRAAAKEAIAILSQRQQQGAEVDHRTQKERNVDAVIRETAGLEQPGASDQTNAVSKPIDSYPAEKQGMIRSYLQAVDEGIRNFVQRVKSGDWTFRRQKIADVSPKTARDIGALLGIDVTGYTHNINTNGVKHILNRHGANGEHDSTMASDEDIARIGWVLENYDSVELLTENGEQVYSEEFRTQENRLAPQIRFVKKIDGSYYVVEAACENRYQKLWVQSAYLQKNYGDVTKVPADGPSADHEDYARSELPSPSPDTSIPDGGGNVNGQSGVKNGAGNFDAMGAASYNFSPFTRMQNEYGNIPNGENPVRPDDAPLSTNGADRVSYTARTAMGAEVTPDEFVPQIEDAVVRGGFSHMPITNDQTTQEASRIIQEEGWEQALGAWTANVRRGMTSAVMVAEGALLYNNAVNSGDYQTAMDILLTYQHAVRNSAQATQAARIMKQLTPENRLHMIRRSIARMVEDMHLNREITIDPETEQAYLNAETEEEADWYLAEIQQSVADQIPATLAERITALRYLNMLGNFRTQARNVAGNLGAKFTYLAKDEIAATIEALASWASGGRMERTKVHWVDRTTRNAARADFENVAQWVSGGGRTRDQETESDAFARGVQERRRILLPGLEQYRRATDWAMNNQYFGDAAFGREAYARALAGYLNARGIRTDNLETVDPNILEQARTYAVQQAQEMTFRDNNQFSDFVSHAMRGPNTPAWARVVGEAVMPFRRTPANVLVRAEEYSPLGLVNSAVATYQAARGNITGAELVESWAKTLTGSGLFIIGWALANMGFLRGNEEDEDKAAFDELNGYQDYAIVLPNGVNLTIDFLSPAAMPMLLGAQFDKILNGTALTMADLEGVFSALADPMIEMSMLQGVNDTIDAIRYADNSMGQFLVNAMTNYLTQALGNTLLGQMERSTESSRMTTYIDKNSGVPAWLQRNLGKLSQKIPGWDYQQTPYLDQWGREQENPEGIANWLYQMLSPAYVDKAKVDAVAEELYRLHEAQSDINVFPQSPEASLTYTDRDGNRHEKYNLTSDQLDTLKRSSGQTQAQIVAELTQSDVYKAMTDQQKAQSISMAYDYARERARIAAIEDYGGYSASWMEGIEENTVDAILNKAVADSISGAFDSLTHAWDFGKDATAGVKALEEAWKAYQALPKEQAGRLKESLSGRAAAAIEAMESGKSPQEFAQYYEGYYAIRNTRDAGHYEAILDVGVALQTTQDLMWLLDGLELESGRKTVRTVQKVEAVSAMDDLSEEEKANVMMLYLSDSQDAALRRMMDAGYDATTYSAVYRADLDTDGGKDATIEAIRELYGLTKTQATKLYEIYAG